MKLNHVLNLLVLGSALTITGLGCKTHPQKPIRIPGENQPVGDNGLNNGTPVNPGPGIDQNQNGLRSDGIPPVGQGAFDKYSQDRVTLQADTVYFDFDKSSIKSGEQSKLSAVGDYLKANTGLAVRIEGNCDSRGTEEYNRSLGERRAQAAREFLVNLGIDAARIDTVSNGEDKPAEQGTTEGAYAKNRRDEFVVLTPPKP